MQKSEETHRCEYKALALSKGTIQCDLTTRACSAANDVEVGLFSNARMKVCASFTACLNIAAIFFGLGMCKCNPFTSSKPKNT